MSQAKTVVGLEDGGCEPTDGGCELTDGGCWAGAATPGYNSTEFELLTPSPHPYPEGVTSVWLNECSKPLKLSWLHPCGCMQAVSIWQWLLLYPHTQQQSPGLWPSAKRTYQNLHAVQRRSTPILLQWK